MKIEVENLLRDAREAEGRAKDYGAARAPREAGSSPGALARLEADDPRNRTRSTGGDDVNREQIEAAYAIAVDASDAHLRRHGIEPQRPDTDSGELLSAMALKSDAAGRSAQTEWN